MVSVDKILTKEERDLLFKFIKTVKEVIQSEKKIEERNSLFLLQSLKENLKEKETEKKENKKKNCCKK